MADTLELILAGKLTNLLSTLDSAAKGMVRLANNVAKVRTAVETSAGAIDRAFSALPGSVREAQTALGGLSTGAQKVGASLTDAAEDAQRAADRIATSANRAASAAKGLGGAGVEAGRGLDKAFGDVGSRISAGADKIRDSIFNIRNAVVGLGAIEVGRRIVTSSAEFGEQIANVSTILDDSSVPIERYREQILALSQTTSKDLVDLTRGLYQTISSGIPAVEGAGGAFDVLDQSQKAAVAGLASTEEAVKAITGVLNAYKAQGLTAAEISDKLFTTVNRGVVEFPELAQSLGQVTSVAASFGVGLDEVLGGIASVTKAGVPAAESITGLRQAFVSIARPPEQVKKKLQELGIEFGVVALQEKGFAGVLDDVIAKTGGSAQAISELFTDVDGLKTVLALASQGTDSFKADIEAVGNSAGATDKAFGKLSETFTAQAARLKNQFGAVLISIGDRLLPKLSVGIEKVSKFLAANKDRIADGFERLFEVLQGIAGFVTRNAGTIVKFIAAFKIAKFIASGVQAIVGFRASVQEAALAAQNLALKVQSVAVAAKGAAAAGQQMAASLGAAGGLAGAQAGTGFLAKLKGALGGPSAIGFYAALGVFIGQQIGDYIGQKLSEVYERQSAEALVRIEKLDAEIQQRVKDRGFKSKEELDELQRQLAAGEAIDVTGRGRNLEAGDILTPAQAVQVLGPDKADAAFRASIKGLRDKRDAIAKESKALGETFVSIQQLAASGNSQVDATLLPKLTADLQNAGARFAETSAALSTLEKRVNLAVKASSIKREKTPGDKPGATGESASAKREKELADLRADLAQARAREAIQAIQDEQKKTAGIIESIERETTARIDGAKVAGATEEDLLDLRASALARIEGLVDEQIALAGRLRDAEIEAARVATQERLAKYADNAQAQALIAAELAREEQRIAAASQDEISKITKEAADRRAADTVAQLQAATAKAMREAGFGPMGGATKPVAEGESATRAFARGAAQAGNDPLGALAAVPGGVGDVASVAVAIRALPGIFAGAGEFLKTGLRDFLRDLGGSAKAFLLGLQDFPKQAARIFGEDLPKFIEEAIGAIPALIAGLDPFTLSTKIAIAFVEAIPNIVRGFARGFERAAASIGRALTSDLARGILGAFKAAGGAIGGAVLRIIAPLVEAVRRVIRAVSRPGDTLGDIGNALLGGADSTGGRIAAGLATGGLSEVVGGIRSIFHTGGTVRGPGDPFAAAQLALSGAPAFAFGGMVPQPGAGARAALSRALRGDDVPAILQSGEGVLSRQGMRALGGEGELAALNRGQTLGGGGVMEVVLEARSDADRALLRSVVGTVRAGIRSPTSPIRQALDQSRTPGPPLMASYVRGRGKG